jgi:hypothetical protein
MHSVQLSNQVTAAYLASKSKFFLLSIGVFVVLTCTVTLSFRSENCRRSLRHGFAHCIEKPPSENINKIRRFG